MGFFHIGKDVSIDRDVVINHFESGWGDIEGSHIWSIGRSASISISTRKLKFPLKIGFFGHAFTGNSTIPYQKISISINGTTFSTLNVTNVLGWYEWVIPYFDYTPSSIKIDFQIGSPISPFSSGVSNDTRELGIRVIKLSIVDTANESDSLMFDLEMYAKEFAKKFSNVQILNMDPEIIYKATKYKSERKNAYDGVSGRRKFYASDTYRNANFSSLNTFEFELVRIRGADLTSIKLEPGSVVLLNNNDCAHGVNINEYIQIYLNNISVKFVLWDHDNHHWYSLSFMIALFSDLYYPAHIENNGVLALFSTKKTNLLPCAVQQFPSDFIRRNIKILIEKKRNKSPLGVHTKYEFAKLRNYIIESISTQIPSVGFIGHGEYLKKNIDERLEEWASNTCSLISPVYSDLPIRVFDCLITGGILIVPNFISHFIDYAGIKSDWVEFYSLGDLDNFENVVDKANKKFDLAGIDGVEERINFALQMHHIDTRVNQIISCPEIQVSAPSFIK